ncbi:MAG: PTS sugar transporter subunit IIA [Erysipelotrichaceae bacterium]|nr:PTS sugar transporter subunit IIA [Erysipelotrichaceae bacterium]
MKGILLTSHGPMAQGILETSKLFFGEQEQIKACCLDANDNPDDFIEVLKSAIDEIDTGDGVIVFCDMLFGSPCNCMARILGEDLQSDRIQVLTGLNLPMILQVLATREAGTETVEELLNAGKDGVSDLRAVIMANM